MHWFFLAVNQRFYSNQSCPCINRNYCPWYKQSKQSLKEVWRSRNTAVKTQLTRMIKGLICDRRKRRIKCCSGNFINSIIDLLTTVKHTTRTPKISNSKSASLISHSIQVSIINWLKIYDTICWILHTSTCRILGLGNLLEEKMNVEQDYPLKI